MNIAPLLAMALVLTPSSYAQNRGDVGRPPGGTGEARPAPDRARATRFGLSAEAVANLLRKYDKNKDGKIERGEYPRSDSAFANLDRDGNGAIEAKDLSANRQPARGIGARRAARGAAPKLPKVGDPAPDFELPMLGMKDTNVKLGSFAGRKPVALIFGSYT